MAWTSSTCSRGAMLSGAGAGSRAEFAVECAGALLGRLGGLSQVLGVAHLASLTLLLLPVDPGPFLAVIALTGSALALSVLAAGQPAVSGDASGLSGAPLEGAEFAQLSPGYAAVLSALKSSEINIGYAALQPVADTSSLADLKAEQRLSGSAELMARVSHELRTPLNAVIGFSEIMGEELFGPVGNARYREYVRHINDSGRELLKSAEDTLALTSLLSHRDGPEDGAPLGIAPLAANAWSFFAAEAARRDICLDVRVAAGIQVIAERRALRQVLINLFSEALDRCEDGGSVVLFAETSGDLVEVEVAVEGTARRGDPTGATLAICLARHLLELQGASLVETGSPDGETWRAVTVLDSAVQADLFCEGARSEA